ncbi:SHOCT domain-containing protein [Thiomicrorhabdus sp. ZW0627]|uniref:SHOCT domain-containing protein n=1 Tax=Thiomicrorhabdus sp. ZW0627 TaxID=3039774 RepID=UPI0024363E03|nr:SHOCT domain-containing protein [Thiomicrorhabdus sp. ZW0627]MDG6773876.1 SHOCT domain-containing protein [Thiomicrorhabdus sp. ZW0627]
MHWYTDMYWAGGMGMWIFWIVLLIVIFVLIRMLSSSNQNVSSETPLEILQKRYAKGEIDQETYEKMKNTLES